MTPSLGSINLLEQLTELRETTYLLDYQFIVGGYWASQVALVAKNLPANAGDIRDTGFPGLERFPGQHGNPLQYSRLENSVDRRIWPATVHQVTVGHD